MQNKNLIDALPFDIVQQVASFLDYKSIVRASKASQTWQVLFNNNSIWKYQLIKEFGIDLQLLSQLFEAQEIKRSPLFYKQLYARFHSLSQQRNLPTFFKNIYRDKAQHELVLLAFTDNFTCLEDKTREEQYIIAVLAIYAGYFKIPYSFIEKQSNQKLLENLLHHASRSGNLHLVQSLLNPENKFGLTPDKAMLDVCAGSGNVQLMQYLLNAENKFDLKPNDYTLGCSAKSGNLELVQYLLNLELKPNDYTLCCAAESGNLHLVQYLLNPSNKFELTPDKDTLMWAALSGNLNLVQYLLDPKNKFGLKPDYSILYNAARSGDLQLVQYLLSSENKFELKPQHSTLNNAAKSGNLQLVQYLLNLENEFGLKPYDYTLNNAAKSGNLQLVQYLLTTFNLIPDHDTLHYAVKFENLELVQYLLNPVNQIGLQVTQTTLYWAALTKNLVLSEFLLPCHMDIQKALIRLQANNPKDAKTLLQQSYRACPSHYNIMLQYILNYPHHFNLNDESIKCLKEITKKRFLEDGETPNPKFNF